MTASLCWTIRSVSVLQEGTIRSKFSCHTGRLQPAVMKFSLVAAVVLLALAQGSFAQDATDFDKFTQYFEEMKNKMIHELSDIINADVATQAQTFVEQGKTQLGPLASQIQDQLQTLASNMEEQIKPLTDNMQAQMQPVFETLKQQMEGIFQKVTEQKAISS